MNNTYLLRKFQQCALLFLPEDPNVKVLLTVLYSCLIPIIICVNLLLIFGIIKTKQNKLTSCQILFSTLFLSDLTFGVVQLPVKIYLFWRSGAPTCLEIQLNTFSMTFPMIMSGTLLCVISIDRYINIVSNQYYKRIATKKLLPVVIISTILISVTCGTFEAFFKSRAEFKRLAISYLVFSGYTAVSLVVGVASNVALLRNVKKQRKNLPRHQRVDSRLTKTIFMIILLMVAAYLPLMITLNIAAYELISSTDKNSIGKRSYNLLLTSIPCQVNAVLNSVIYLSRCRHLKEYYYNLFNCQAFRKFCTETVPSVAKGKVALDVAERQVDCTL